MPKGKLLIIDDQPDNFNTFCNDYKDTYDIELVRNSIHGLSKLAQGGWQISIVDLDMGEGGYKKGLSHFLPLAIKKANNRFPILVYSSDNRSDTPNIAKELGASDFLHKTGGDSETLHLKLQDLINNFNPAAAKEEIVSTFIARSQKMQDIKKRLRKMVNYTDVPVLILGETGVGKEIAARYIHESKKNQKLPFEAVNLSAFSSELLRSEVFGHVKGAFTGATSDKVGLFSLAKKGTLFLDEIGEIEESTQVQLLRVLEEKTYKQLGGIKDFDLDTHLVLATNKNMEEAVEEGSFRADFYERISTLTIHIPPLRERKEDIMPLMEHFLSKSCHEGHPLYQSSVQDAFTEDALEKMYNYSWPHNVRQLANTVQKLIFEVDVHDRNIIEADLLPLNVIRKAKTSLKQQIDPKQETSTLSKVTTNSTPPTHQWPMAKQTAYEELTRIENALIQEGGRKEEAAKRLGMKNDQTLRYRVKKKYFKQYPDLFEDFHTICKIYKLDI